MTYCGGASSISPAARAASASSGVNQCTLSISEPSATSSPPRDRAHEEPRREPLRRTLRSRPVREMDQRVGVDVDPGFFLRLAHGSSARRAREIVGRVAVVVGIDAAAGEHPRAAVERELRRAAGEQHLEAGLAVAQQHDRRGGRGDDTARYGTRASFAACRRSSIQLFNEELTLFVTGPQHLLVELTDRRLRHFVDEAPPLGHLPFRDVIAEVRRRARPRRRVGAACARRTRADARPNADRERR